jgi:O-antigen ligase
MLLFTFVHAEDAGLRLALALTMALVVAALLLTFSRGAFVAFILANVVFVLWRRSPRTWIAFALVVAVGLAALPAGVYERLGTGLGQGLNAVTAGRWEGLWVPLFPEVMRSPVYGSGLSSILWSEAMRGSGGVTVLAVTHPHNAYLESLLDLGIAGTLLLLAYYAHAWRGFTALARDATLTPAMRGFYQGSAAALLCIMFANLTDGSLRPKAEQAFLWLAIGMMYGQRYRAGSRRESA